MPGSLAVTPLSVLTAMLARDLFTDFGIEWFRKMLIQLVKIINTSEIIEDTEAVLRTIFYLARILEKQLVGDLALTFSSILRPAFLVERKPKQHVIQALTELWASFGRKILLPSKLIDELVWFSELSPACLTLTGQLMAVVCFDERSPPKFLPKHLRTIANGLIERDRLSLLEAFFASTFNLDSGEAVVKAAAESLLVLPSKDAIVPIVERIVETSCQDAVLLSLIPVPSPNEKRAVQIVCRFLCKYGMNLAAVLKARPLILPILTQSPMASLHAMWILFGAHKEQLISPLFSASAIEKIIGEAYAQDPLAALALLQKCRSKTSSQFSRQVPSIDYASLLSSSNDHALIVLALRLQDHCLSSQEFLALAQRLLGPDLNQPSTLLLALLDSWLSHEEVCVSEEVTRMIAGWTGYASVLDLLRRSSVSNYSILMAAKKGLLSGDSKIRTEALRLLESLCTAPTVLLNLLKLETGSSWTFSCDREKGIHLTAIYHRLQKDTEMPAEEGEIVIRHLTGLVLGGFRPIQSETGRVLTAYVQRFGSLFRRTVADVISLLNEHINEPAGIVGPAGDPFDSEAISAEIMTPFRQSKMYGPHALASFFEFLAKQPASMDFIQNDLIALLLQVYTTEDHSFTGQFVKKLETSLAAALQAFAGLKNLSRNPQAEPFSHLLLDRFLPLGDALIQQRALSAYLAVSSDGMPMWRDHLHGLLESEQAMREKLVELAAASGEHRVVMEEPLRGVLIRLLYGRMVSRKSAGAGRTSPKVRRKLVLNYVATWDGQSIGAFIRFLCSTLAGTQEASKQRGFLSLLEPVLSKLLRFTPVEVLAELWQLMMQLAGAEEKAVRRLALLRLHQTWAVLLQPGSQPEPHLEAVLIDSHEALWRDIVGPRVAQFDAELGQGKSALLDLLALWAQQRPELMLQALPSLITALGASADRVKPGVAAQLVDIFEALLASEVATEPLSQNMAALLEAIAARLATVLDSNAEASARLAKRLLNLLVSLADRITAGQPAVEALLRILVLGSDRLVSARNEALAAAVLRVMGRLVPLSTEVIETEGLTAYDHVARWFSLPGLCTRASREALAALFLVLTERVRPEYTALAKALSDLSAYEADCLDDEADWERRTAGFSALRSMAPSSCPSDAPAWWLPVLSWCVWEMGRPDAELGGRNQAEFLLESFLAHPNLEGDSLLVQDCLLSGLRGAMRSPKSSDEVRSGMLALLGRLTARFPTTKPFSALTPLLAGGDEEANVLLNAGHIQLHRRARAVRRLGEWAAASESEVERKTVEEILIPFLKPLAIPSEDVELDATLQTEALGTMALLIGRLPLKAALTRLTLTIKRLKASSAADRTKESNDPGASAALKKKGSKQTRALLRLVQAIVTRALLPLLPASDEEAGGVAPVEALLALLFDAALPPAGGMVLPLAESIGSILAVRSEALRALHLPRLMAALCSSLRDKDVVAREAARSAFSRLMAALGPAYLAYALGELESALLPRSHAAIRAKTGSAMIASNTIFSHVHGYTVATVLATLCKEQKALNLSDAVFKSLSQVAMDHGLGPLAKEKTRGSTGASGQEWTGRAVEAREQRSYEMMSLLVQQASISQLKALLQSLSERILQCEAQDDSEQQIQPSFKAIETALLNRIKTRIELQGHMLLLHSLATAAFPSASPSINGHRFALLGMSLLIGVAKDQVLSVELTPFFDGFIAPLVDEHCAATCRHAALTTTALRSLTAILNAAGIQSLPSLASRMDAFMLRLFELLVKTDARGAETSAAALRLIATAVRALPDVKLTDSQTRALLAYTGAHLEHTDSGQAAIAFGLVKALLTRKVLMVELVELITAISKHMLLAPDASVRAQCRSVYAQFLLEYPLGEQKLQEHLAGILKNMAAFEWDTGRQSAALLVANLVTRLPAVVLSAWSSLVILSIAGRIAADPSAMARTALSDAIAALGTRLVSDNGLQQSLGEATTLLRKWLELSEKPAVTRAAWSIAKSFLTATGQHEVLSALSKDVKRIGLDVLLNDETTACLETVIDTMGLMMPDDEILAALSTDRLMTWPILAVRDGINRLLLDYAASLSGSEAVRLAAIWTQQLLELPSGCEQPIADRLVKCLVSVLPAVPEAHRHLERIEKTMRAVLGEPASISDNRVTIAAALKLAAGALIALPHESSEAEECPHLAPITAFAIRVATNDHLSATQASSVDRALAESLRTTANELLELLQATLGTERYTNLTQSVVQASARSKAARKTALSHLVLPSPHSASSNYFNCRLLMIPRRMLVGSSEGMLPRRHSANGLLIGPARRPTNAREIRILYNVHKKFIDEIAMHPLSHDHNDYAADRVPHDSLAMGR